MRTRQKLLHHRSPPNFGASVEIGPGDVQQTVVQITGDDWDAQMVTLAISYEPQLGPAQPANPQPLRLIGELTWGVGGTGYKAQLDYRRGQMICIPATYLRLDVRYESPSGPMVKAQALMAYGGRPTSAPVTLTRPVGMVGNNEQARVDVPPWAHEVALFSPAPQLIGGLSVSTEFAGGTLSTHEVQSSRDRVRIDAAAERIVVTNGAGQPVDVTAVFALGL